MPLKFEANTEFVYPVPTSSFNDTIMMSPQPLPSMRNTFLVKSAALASTQIPSTTQTSAQLAGNQINAAMKKTLQALSIKTIKA